MNIITVTEQKKWDNFVAKRKEANFLQSWDFYEFHKNRGKKIVRRAMVDDEDKIIAVYGGVVETAKRGTYLAIAGGPIMDFDDKKLVREIFQDIKTQGQVNNCVFVRIRPQLPLSNQSLKLMQDLGLKKAPMYLSVEYAGILDLNKTEEEILAGASQGLRRKIRKAEKADIKISADDNQKSIQDFCALEKKHAERQKYVAFSESFLTKQFEAFKENNEVLIYTAKKDGEILAQNFIIFYGPEAS